MSDENIAKLDRAMSHVLDRLIGERQPERIKDLANAVQALTESKCRHVMMAAPAYPPGIALGPSLVDAPAVVNTAAAPPPECLP